MTTELLLAFLEKLRDGKQIEGPNLDVKQKWWDLRSPGETSEFLKDICSFGNTQSGDSHILIGIGKDGTLYDAPLPDDEANLQVKHKEKIDPKLKIEIDQYTIEGKKLSVITIPHSQNRPHVIKKYKNDRENWVPIRFGSSTLTASRSDLDEMYKERNAQMGPKVQVRLHENAITWSNYAAYQGWTSFGVKITIDNYEGNAPEYITKVFLEEQSGDHWRTQHFGFDSEQLTDQSLRIEAHELRESVLVYLSDQLPDHFNGRRSMPDFDRDTLQLIVETRSGNRQVIPLKPAWIREG